MSKELFVGGLNFSVTDRDLRGAFSPFGEVVDARVVTQHQSGRSHGFGFVSFREDTAAKDAMVHLDGAELQGRALRVDAAQKRSSRGGGAHEHAQG